MTVGLGAGLNGPMLPPSEIHITIGAMLVGYAKAG